MLTVSQLRTLRPWKAGCTNTVGRGSGLAVSPSLRVVVTSEVVNNTLSVWGLVSGNGSRDGLPLLYTLGGKDFSPGLNFKQFAYPDDHNFSGNLAFIPDSKGSGQTCTTPYSRQLLLVTDVGHHAVHIIDVVNRTHEGYLASPGTILGPRGITASGTCPLVAVSSWPPDMHGTRKVTLFRRQETVWEAFRVIDGSRTSQRYLAMPCGLRFNSEGTMICVADRWRDCVIWYRVEDGVIDRKMFNARDVEQVEGGWLVLRSDPDAVVYQTSRRGGESFCLGGKDGKEWGMGCPTAFAVVPGLGLVVRDYGGASGHLGLVLRDYGEKNGRLQVFCTPDVISMLTMSEVRIAWMATVARGVFARRAKYHGHWSSRW